MFAALLFVFGCSSPNRESPETITTEVEAPADNIASLGDEEIPASLGLMNAVRNKGCTCGVQKMQPAPSLRWNRLLYEAALRHATDMQANAYFSHKAPSGSTPGSRAQDVGYQWRMVAENIAKGQPDEETVIAGWIESPGHCTNLMNPDYTEVGMARVGDYWVQVFGTR